MTGQQIGYIRIQEAINDEWTAQGATDNPGL